MSIIMREKLGRKWIGGQIYKQQILKNTEQNQSAAKN